MQNALCPGRSHLNILCDLILPGLWLQVQVVVMAKQWSMVFTHHLLPKVVEVFLRMVQCHNLHQFVIQVVSAALQMMRWREMQKCLTEMFANSNCRAWALVSVPGKSPAIDEGVVGLYTCNGTPAIS